MSPRKKDRQELLESTVRYINRLDDTFPTPQAAENKPPVLNEKESASGDDDALVSKACKRRPKQQSFTLQRYLSPSNEDYVSLSLHPSPTPDASPVLSPATSITFVTPTLHIASVPGFHRAVETPGAGDAASSLRIVQSSSVPLATPVPQRTYPSLVSELFLNSPYFFSQPAPANLFPEAYVTSQREVEKHGFRPLPPNIPAVRRTSRHVGTHVLDNTTSNMHPAPTEPRAMRSAREQANKSQVYIEGAAMTEELPSKTQEKESNKEETGNAPTQVNNTHIPSQQGITIQSVSAQNRHLTNIRAVQARRSLRFQAPQFQTSPLRQQVELEESNEGQGESTVSRLQTIHERAEHVNTQLRRSSFQGQGEYSTLSVRAPTVFAEPLIVDGQADIWPTKNSTTANTAMLRKTLPDDHHGSGPTDFQALNVQNRSVPPSTNVQNSPSREKSQLLNDRLKLLNDRLNNPQDQTHIPSAEVHSPLRSHQETGLPSQVVPLLQHQAEFGSINFHNASFRRHPGTEVSKSHSPPFQGPAEAAYPIVHTSPARGDQEIGFENPITLTLDDQVSATHPGISALPVRGAPIADFGNQYASTSHSQVPITHPNTRTSPIRAGPLSDFRNKLPPVLQGQPSIIHSSLKATPLRGVPQIRFGNQYVSPSHSRASSTHRSMRISPAQGGSSTGFRNQHGSSPSHDQAAPAYQNMQSTPALSGQMNLFGRFHESPLHSHSAYQSDHTSTFHGRASGRGNPNASPVHGQAATSYQNMRILPLRGDQEISLGNPPAWPLQRQAKTAPANFQAHNDTGAGIGDPYISPLQVEPIYDNAPVHGEVGPSLVDPRTSPSRALNPRSVSFHVPQKLAKEQNCYHWMTFGKCSPGYGPCPYAHPIKEEVEVPELKGPSHYASGMPELSNMERKAEEPLTVGPKAMSQPYELLGNIQKLVSENTKLQRLAKAPFEEKKFGNGPASVADASKSFKEMLKDFVEQFNVYAVEITRGLKKLLDYGPILSTTLGELNATETQSEQLEIIDRCGKEIFAIIKRQRTSKTVDTKTASTTA